jgi:hypothetical protein
MRLALPVKVVAPAQESVLALPPVRSLTATLIVSLSELVNQA